jgi:hypothetical protein
MIATQVNYSTIHQYHGLAPCRTHGLTHPSQVSAAISREEEYDFAVQDGSNASAASLCSCLQYNVIRPFS